MIIEAIVVREPSRLGRSNVVDSIVMSAGLPNELAVADMREPVPSGSPETS